MSLLFNTEAIVIRSMAYGETHAIVTLLTPSGTVSAMARGAKKPQSRLAAGIQLCAQGMYSLYQRSGMANIQQVEVLDSRRVLREQLELAAYAAYFCELVGAVAEERPNGSEAVFRTFQGALNRMATADDPSRIARVWEAKVAVLLGIAPNWLQCVRCGNELDQLSWYRADAGGLICDSCEQLTAQTSSRFSTLRVPPPLPRLLFAMSRAPWDRIGKISFSDETERTLSQILRHQLTAYGGLSLKSRNVLDSMNML